MPTCSGSEASETGVGGSLAARRLDELLDEPDEPLHPIIGDGGDGAVLTADGKGFVARPTGIGKTNLLLRLSRCICEPSPFLGLPVSRHRRVLYLALEGSPRAMKKRLRKVWADAPPEVRERFYIAHAQLNLGNDPDLERLDQLLYSSPTCSFSTRCATHTPETKTGPTRWRD